MENTNEFSNVIAFPGTKFIPPTESGEVEVDLSGDGETATAENVMDEVVDAILHVFAQNGIHTEASGDQLWLAFIALRGVVYNHHGIPYSLNEVTDAMVLDLKEFMEETESALMRACRCRA